MTASKLKEKVDGDTLDLSLMSLKEVPVNDITGLPKVKQLDLSNNEISFLPSSFAPSLKFIVKLDLGSNQLSKLPSNFGELSSLKHLDLYNNELSELPCSFADLGELRWIDVKGNPLNKDFSLAAGDCGDFKECTLAAKKLINLCHRLRERQNKELAMKAAKQKEVDQQLQEKEERERKAEKKLAKEQRKQKQKTVGSEPSNKQQKTETTSSKKSNSVSNGNPKVANGDKSPKKSAATGKQPVKAKGGLSSLAKMNLVLFVLLLFSGAFCFYLYSDGDFSAVGAQKTLIKLEENGRFLLTKLTPVMHFVALQLSKLFDVIRSMLSSVANYIRISDWKNFDFAATTEAIGKNTRNFAITLYDLIQNFYSCLFTYIAEGRWKDALSQIVSLFTMFGSFLWDQFLVVREEIKRNEALQSIAKDYGSLGHSLMEGLSLVLGVISNWWEILITKWLPEAQHQAVVLYNWAKQSLSHYVN